MALDKLDAAVLQALPDSCQIISVARHGDTHWSTGYKVEVQVGTKPLYYFLKIMETDALVGMAEAEYEGQKAISQVIPHNSVVPISWGFFEGTESKSWYLAEFRNLGAIPPCLDKLLPIVKRLHQESASPTGKFGFHVTPYYGPPPMIVEWTDSWEEFWAREFRAGLKYVQNVLGQDAELTELGEELLQKVVPRLLRPLQTGGRNIKPSLCHGDLWDGNIQADVETGEPILFDPCPFYGHHEMEFQCMKSPRYIVGKNFINLYQEKIGVSEPAEDFEDRVNLYAIRNDLMLATMWPKFANLINQAKDDMRTLLQKYPQGLDGFEGSLTPTNSMND